MAKSPPFRRDYPVGTKWRYSSGALHAAYDYLTPMGTDVLAVRDGVILDCQDGMASSSPTRNYSGEPSNWILLGYRNRLGQKRTVYYQHLSRGLRVKRGDKVTAGQHIADTGSSGNSSGPHCHIAAMKGWQSRYSRYAYMTSATTRIYPPSLCWAKTSL